VIDSIERAGIDEVQNIGRIAVLSMSPHEPLGVNLKTSDD
jgi:hypothetical protein